MAAEAGMPGATQAPPDGDTEMAYSTENGASQAEAGRRPAEGDEDSIRKGKRLKLELEPLPVDRVEKINPDGTFSLLPPENPEEIFARKVAFLRKEKLEKKAEAEAAKSGPKKVILFPYRLGGNCVHSPIVSSITHRKVHSERSDSSAAAHVKQPGFLWKDGVDSVRVAAHHAQQLSAFLDFLSKR